MRYHFIPIKLTNNILKNNSTSVDPVNLMHIVGSIVLLVQYFWKLFGNIKIH